MFGQSLKFSCRDLCWSLLALALVLGWWVYATAHVVVNEGDAVTIVRHEPYGQLHLLRGVAHSITPEAFSVDISGSAPVADGVVLTKSGDCAGMVAGMAAGSIRVLRIVALRKTSFAAHATP